MKSGQRRSLRLFWLQNLYSNAGMQHAQRLWQAPPWSEPNVGELRSPAPQHHKPAWLAGVGLGAVGQVATGC